jgi:hypothetical protein
VAHPLFNLVLPNRVGGLDHVIKSFMISREVPSRNGKNAFQDEAQPFKKEHVSSRELDLVPRTTWGGASSSRQQRQRCLSPES